MNTGNRWQAWAARCALSIVIGIVVVLGLPAMAGAQGQPPPPIEHFFENNAFGGAVLSPNGLFLAVRTNKPGRRDFLAVVELETMAAKVVAEYSDSDVGEVQWVNDRRLVYTLQDRTDNEVSKDFAPGLFAVDRDGGRPIQLAVRNQLQKARQPWNTFLMDQVGSQDSDWIYALRPTYDRNDTHVATRLRRINTVTGEGQVVPEPEVDVHDFLLDAKGEPRLAMRYTEQQNTMFYRERDSGKWREVARFDNYRNPRNQIKPVDFGPDGSLYVIAHAGADLATLRTLDLATGAVSKDAVVAAPGYDFVGGLIQNDKLLGVHFVTDATSTVWVDSKMKALQETVDKALPRTVNLIAVPARAGAPWMLVKAYSDVQPLRYFIVDVKSGQLNPVGASYPKIDPAGMGRQEAVRYKARDGLDIPGLLTLPPGGVRKQLPMVVLVHGGPWVRGSSWGWHPESQFLATRGYAVLEVQFRGSLGFGAKHFQAGFKQWGLAMQNDLADGARWAIREGIADPKRICIAGASYGGYAALMGLVNDPDLYRCAVNWVGVTDIQLMYADSWLSKSDMTEDYLRYGLPVLVGDRDKDAAQLQATSPIQQAARIHQPVLLAYGAEDQRVPIFHGKRFYAAVKETNKQVEWVVYSDEGHGWTLPKNRIDFWGRVERFLDKSIGASAAGKVADKP